jgi:hypothetical protein
VLDFGAVDRLPDGFPPFMGRLLRIVHDGSDLAPAERELREQGFIREGIEFDPEALRAFLAPLAEPSRVERFRFNREWLRGEATRVTDPRAANMTRRLNLPPSYVLIHRVSTAGIGVLCQLECEGPYRAEMIRWMPGYSDADRPADKHAAGEATAQELNAGELRAEELVTDEPAAQEITTAEELTAGKLGASGLTANGLSPHRPTGNGLTANGLTAKQLTVEEPPATDLTAESLTAEGLTTGGVTAEDLAAEGLTAGSLTAEELTPEGLITEEPSAGGPAADAAAGPGEPDPVGPAR